MLNFNLRQFKRIDGSWGSFDRKTGKWGGMVSNLVNGEADIITANFDNCCGREAVVDYCWTLSEGTPAFGIRSKQLRKTSAVIPH